MFLKFHKFQPRYSSELYSCAKNGCTTDCVFQIHQNYIRPENVVIIISIATFKHGSVIDSFEIPPQLQSARYQTVGYFLFFGYLLRIDQKLKNTI